MPRRARNTIGRHLALALAGAGLFLHGPHVGANDAGSINILATDWGLTLKADGSGFYNELARLLLEGEEAGIRYEIQPYRKAVRQFVDTEGTCLFPTNLSFLARSGLIDGDENNAVHHHYVQSRPFIRARIHLFSQPGTPPVHNLETIRGQTVAYALGASTPYLLRQYGAFFIAVADETDKAQLLLSRKVDMMTAALPDALFVFRSLGVPPAPYAADAPVDVSLLHVACHGSDTTRAFLARLDQRIATLIASGRLAAFFEGHSIDPNAYIPAGATDGGPKTPGRRGPNLD
ncbi:MAG: hypothetical protein EP335_17700 [Alphaproteobacteria bacterium]|nr:MAG: hypothetical protein EP335_17700 [Alphaproteobacteria bacterium]